MRYGLRGGCRTVMRVTTLSIGVLTLLLLFAVPVNAAPALRTGSQSSYNLSVSISFIQSCAPVLSSTLNAGIVCPMLAMVPLSFNINGTLAWTVTSLNATTADLNVTRDITDSSGEAVTPATDHNGRFNESINLATRIVTILPFIEPELDEAIQMAQSNGGASVTTSAGLSSTMLAINTAMMRQHLYTMWWINGPLKVNDTVPVLVFPTNVIGSTSLNLGGSIGTRSAWTLAFPRTESFLPPDPTATMTSSILISDKSAFTLTLNYDQTSDLLLTANANIHLGFGEETFLPPTPCDSSATTAPALTVCPVTPIPIMREFGIDVQASLKITSTTLDLSQRIAPTSSPDSSKGSSSGSGSGGGSGSGTGSGTDSGTVPGPGSNSGSNSGPGSGYGPGSGSPAIGSGQPANSVQSKPAAQSAGLLPWMYGILGVIAAAIIGSAVWIARRRMKKGPSQVV